MGAQLRVYRQKIKSAQTTKKITRAMELIAASRIIKAQQRAQAAAPYARELTRAVSAVATFSNVDHALTVEPENPTKAAVLIVTSDRGLAGAYSSSVLKEAERLIEKLHGEGKEVDVYISGRKGEAYFKFRQRPIVQAWTGFSDQPTYDVAQDIGQTLISAFLSETGQEPAHGEAPGVDEVHVVYTRFRSMLHQEPTAVRLLPLEVVEGEEAPAAEDVLPLYEFEPSPGDVLDYSKPYIPQFNTMRINTDIIGSTTGEFLMNRLRHAKQKLYGLKVNQEFVDRGSCAPPRQGAGATSPETRTVRVVEPLTAR